MSLAIDSVLSDEVPVYGVLESEVRSETVWRAEPPEERVVRREVTRLLLREFGGPEG